MRKNTRVARPSILFKKTVSLRKRQCVFFER